MSDTETKTGTAIEAETEAADGTADPRSEATSTSGGAAAAAAGEAGGRRRAEVGLGERIMRFLSSFGLTTGILLCLMVLTYFGTKSQMDIGLVRAQHEYFDSFVCRLDLKYIGIDGFGIRFPGALLLLSLLIVNLVCGGIVRIKWKPRNAGILIAHFGIIFLLAAGLVKFLSSTNGAIQLDPGEAVSEYRSFHEWEVVIAERLKDGSVREHLIPDKDLARLGTFHSELVPFRLKVERYYANARPKAASASSAAAVGGTVLEKLPWNDQASMNVPGAYIEVEMAGGAKKHGVLFGMARQPFSVVVDGEPWSIWLRRQVFDLPFQVRLERFVKEEHPGVDTPRTFESFVTKIEDGVEQKFHVKMNEPMRYGGYMLSQNNWGPQDGSPPPYYSVLEVSSNPSDQWPKYACFVIAFGLLIHFIQKLRIHVARQVKARAQEVAA